jgi:hypothetical protein
MAVTLLPVFAAALFLGTLVESWYDSKVAHQLVYGTWWFATLLGLLGVNIFFAAVKKWPWKMHQTGFLITHVGLLTLVAGGLVNNLAGSGGLMILVDSDHPSARNYGTHSSHWLIDRGIQTIRVRHNQDEVFNEPFEPGPLPWRPDEYLQPQIDPAAAVLGWLAHPLPRSWSRDLGGGARLEVLAYYPHAREERFGPARADDRLAFPAAKVQLASAAGGILPPQWVACYGADRLAYIGPGLMEMLGRDLRSAQMAEFRNPPSPTRMGPQGELVLGLEGEALRFDVAAVADHPTALGASGWSLRRVRVEPARGRAKTDSSAALSFELSGPAGRTIPCTVSMRQPGEIMLATEDQRRVRAPKGLWAWYNVPDVRYGDSSIRAVLQFAMGADGPLAFRSFSSAGTAGFHFEKSGTAESGAPRQRIWEGMNWKFQVLDYLPRAAPGPYFIPENRRLGLEDDAAPALRCRLSTPRASEEFWVGKTDGGLTPVQVGGDRYQVGYNSYLHELDFSITLLRAEQTTDRGSAQPASQSSYILLTDRGRGIQAAPYAITMNQPLEYRGYKFYQGGYQPLGQDDHGRRISRAVFTVGNDPGLWLKYVGSTMLALGVACMFYMKAYFFKR